MAQGEQGGGAPPQEPSNTPRVGPSPGAMQAAREQAERARAAADERERERYEPPPAPEQGYVQHPPAQQPGAPQGAWPTWQARPSQPSWPQYQQPEPEQQPQPQQQAPSQPQQSPPQPASYPQPQQPSYPAYQQPPYPPPGYGQTPYGYQPVPYGWERPLPYPPVAVQNRDAVKTPPDEHPTELPWQLAGWWSRVGAQLIDLLIVWVPLLLVLFVLILVADSADNGSAAETTWIVVAGVTTFVAWAVHLFYAPLLMKRKGDHNGQSWGKQLCKIRVIRADGRPMRFSDAALRQIIYKSFGMLVASTFIPLFPWVLNYLWPTWDEQHRALHDLAADTRVVAA